MTTSADIAAVAGPSVGGGLAAWAGFKFVRWLVEFIFARLDIRRSQLGQRLRHVELELDNFREAVFILMNALAAKDPTNKALQEAAERLRKTPRATLELDDLEARLRGIE